MKYDELIILATKIITSFNSSIMSPDTHTLLFLQQHSRQLFDTEKLFLSQVFSGHQRYKQLLIILTKTLFDSTTTSNRNDSILYQIFAYITLFRFEEIPFNEFKDMILSQDPFKMHILFSFIFDKDTMNRLIKPQWIEIYDPTFVEENLLEDLETNLVIMKPLLNSLSQKATGKTTDELINIIEEDIKLDDKKLGTPRIIFKPFTLHDQKYKILPEPIVLPKKIKVNPVPDFIYNTSLVEIENSKKQRLNQKKNEIIENYKISDKQPFELQTLKRPHNIDKIKKEVEEQLKSTLQFDKKIAIPMPDFEKNSYGQVKYNVATVLREQVKFNQDIQNEEKKIKQLEQGLRDSTEFENWKQKQKALQTVQQIEHQQQVKIEMEIARDLAVKAQQDKMMENKSFADDMKVELKERQNEREVNKQQEMENNKKLIESVLIQRENMINEKAQLIKRNKKSHDDDVKEKLKIKERKKLEDEAVFKKRQELILQIKEFEKQPHRRENGYDPTETVGLGLFDEMSMVELRERLEELKITKKQEEEQRRSQIMTDKNQFINKIKNISQIVHEQRDLQRERKNEERRKKQEEKFEEEEIRKAARQKSLLSLNEQIRNKKNRMQKEEQRIADDDKETQLKQQYMSANKDMVEFKQWEAIEKGDQREIKGRQNDKLYDQYKMDEIKHKDRKVLAHAASSLIHDKINFIKGYDNNIDQSNRANEIMYSEMRNLTLGRYSYERDWETKHQKNMGHRNEYIAKANDINITRARQFASTNHL